MIIKRKYFLYRHIRLDKDEVFYIGIGSKRSFDNPKRVYSRAYNKSARNIFWKRIVSKTEYEVEILLESDEFEFIKEMETELIKLYGKRCLHQGTLCNLRDGGEKGGTGYFGNPVHAYDVEGKYVQSFLSVAEASRNTRISWGTIKKDIKTQKEGSSNRKLFFRDYKVEKISISIIKKSISIEQRNKISFANKGRVRTEEAKRKLSEYKKEKRAILQFDTNMNFIQEWNREQLEAISDFNMSSLISKIRLNKPYKKHIWKYKNDNFKTN